MIGDDELSNERQSDELLQEWGYPPALIKACGDYFDYAMGLSDGRVIMFAEARPINRCWVHIVTHPMMTESLDKVGKDFRGYGYNFERGIDVRVASILWCADAPFGS